MLLTYSLLYKIKKVVMAKAVTTFFYVKKKIYFRKSKNFQEN